MLRGSGQGHLISAVLSLPNCSWTSSKGTVCQTTSCSASDLCLLYACDFPYYNVNNVWECRDLVVQPDP